MVSLGDRADRRWDARRAGQSGEMTIVQESVQCALPLPASVVWDFIDGPDSSPVLVDGFVRSFPVPDTPVGEVGEVRCSVIRADAGFLVGTFSERVELEPGRRSVSKSLSTPDPVITIQEVVPAGDSACVVRLTGGISVRQGAEGATRDQLQARLATVIDRLREVLAAMYPGR
jgi:hypothetical protein